MKPFQPLLPYFTRKRDRELQTSWCVGLLEDLASRVGYELICTGDRDGHFDVLVVAPDKYQARSIRTILVRMVDPGDIRHDIEAPFPKVQLGKREKMEMDGLPFTIPRVDMTWRFADVDGMRSVCCGYCTDALIYYPELSLKEDLGLTAYCTLINKVPGEGVINWPPKELQ